MSSEKEQYDRAATPGQTKIEMVQAQIDSTKGEMQKTLQDLANRGRKLEELEEQTVMLSDSASVFKTSSSKVRRNMWWKNTKMTVILTITILIILAAIIVPTVLKLQGKI
ncbi:synaptobrevin [Rhizophagus irregularis]|uniref:Synaptobrevin n=1 Tax=Rhizophagus irregularis TaxID=588596 RepID=A0A2I1FVC2_9GLOM|nr:synaptobrevin [Rhizophagus irregularis]